MSLNCIICSSLDLIEFKSNLRDSDDHKVVRCGECGQVQISPMPLIIEDKNFYDNNMQAKLVFKDIDMDIMKLKTSIEINRQYNMFKENINKNHKILEIGSGYGFFVEYMQGKGYDIEGIEISDSRRKYGVEQLGCKIYNLNILSQDIPDILYERYDRIFLLHVLEHISRPEEFLREIKKMLKINGTLIIEVPNLEDHMLERCQPYKEFYFQRAHLTYFDKITLDKLLERSGYLRTKVEGSQRYSLYNSLIWINNGVPQLGYQPSNGIEWVESFYKDKLIEEFKCDTLVVYCKKYS